MTDRTPNIDVTPGQWSIIKDILAKYVPEGEVWAFGSRARHTAKPYSDLDLAIISPQPLTLDTRTALADEFSMSDLPWKVDIVDWATASESFKKTVAAHKVLIWTPEAASST
ncbi:nucleotidyltransferase family protein [Castellaniella denitrificans]|uniref:nucleotidyltransferase family protein n=1 Tax=Castellaniella denitrificans TaxID=56119 RepID=UPI003615A7B8